MAEKYQLEQKQLLDRLNAINKETSEQEKKEQGVIDFVNLIKQYNGITELTANIVNSLIDRIEVFERYKEDDGTIKQDVKIFYKFVGTIDNVNYKVEKMKPYLSEKEVTCLECGETFKTKANSAKYCEKCRLIVHRRQCTEGKRRSRERQKLLKQQGKTA